MLFFGKTGTFPVMRHILLAIMALIAALFGRLLFPAYLSAQQAPALAQPATQATVKNAASQMERRTAVSAKVKLSGELMGHVLTGQGSYLQLKVRNDLLVRLELRLTVGNQRSVVQQIYDGRFLWQRRDLPGNSSITRVDMRQVRETMAGDVQATAPVQPTSNLAIGGLLALLQAFDAHFNFQPPRESKIGEIPVWVLNGKWKQKTLAQLLPSQAKDILAGKPPEMKDWPGHAPASVQIVLARGGALDLFPFRVEYFRPQEKDEDPDTMLKLEFFEVRAGAALRPAMFAYTPGNPEVLDVTAAYIKKLQARAAAD